MLKRVGWVAQILDETLGNFASLTDSVVEDNEVGPKHTATDGPKKGTRATLSATVPAGQTEVVLDFSSALIMPPTVGIAEARCSLLSSSFATGLAAAPMGNKLHVTLERAAPADAENGVAVLCDVDQSQRSCAAH